MFHSKIEKILEEKIEGNEELQNKKSKFHKIEYEIDTMANKKKKDENNKNEKYVPCYDLSYIIEEAKKKIYQIFEGHHVWLDGKWHDIEKDIKHNLEDLEKNKKS